MKKKASAQADRAGTTGPRRTCAVCRKEDGPDQLIRWVCSPEGEVVPDLLGRSFGRGAWTHPHAACLKDLQKHLSRSFRQPIVTPTNQALSLLGAAANHRILQLLGAARRQNKAVFGADATSEAFSRGQLSLVLVATDAQAASRLGVVTQATLQGMACAWGTKEKLGALFGRSAVGVLGLCDRGLATGLFGAIAMALLVQGQPESRADESPES